jgi:hypothetical protein
MSIHDGNCTDGLQAVLGFTSFGKRKRSAPKLAERKTFKVLKLPYAPKPIQFVQAHSLLSHDRLHLALQDASRTIAISTTVGALSSSNLQLSRLSLLSDSLHALLVSKKRLHDAAILPSVFRSCRAFANTFEALGKHHFVNRSAMKMAELDARLGLTLNFMHGNIQEKGQDSLNDHTKSCFSFVDICGAPGGFSEYLIRRCQRLGYASVHGHGISIRPNMRTVEREDDDNGNHDHYQDHQDAQHHQSNSLHWQLDQDTLAHMDISYGADGTGDIYNPSNIQCFVNQVQYVKISRNTFLINKYLRQVLKFI